MEPAVVMKHLPCSQMKNQVESVFPGSSGAKELTDWCLKHDLAESRDSMPCVGQEILLYEQCPLTPEMNQHVDNDKVSDKNSCLKESHNEAVTAHLKGNPVISIADNVVNHFSCTARKALSRNEFRACCSNEFSCSDEAGFSNKAGCSNETSSSNEETRHLLNNRAETGLQKHIKHTVADKCYEQDQSHRSSSVSHETDEYKNNNSSHNSPESDASHSDQNVQISFASIEQTAHVTGKHHTLINFDGSSKIDSICKVTSGRSFFQEQSENKSLKQTADNDKTGSDLLLGTCKRLDVDEGLDVKEGLGVEHQNVEGRKTLAVISSENLCRGHQDNLLSVTENNPVTQNSTLNSDGMFFITECQGRSVSVTNDLLVQTSPKLIPARLFVQETLSADNEGGKQLLNCPKQNRLAANLNSSRGFPESLCKVVTKYVYINKSLKSITSKKRFGILYRQAFRHFHGAKLEKKKKQKMLKKISVVKEKIKKKESPIRTLSRKKTEVVFVNKEDDLRNQSREARNKSREDRRLARELRKCLSKDVNKEVVENKNGIRKRKIVREHEVIKTCRRNVVSVRSKQKQNSKKLLSLENKTTSMQATGSSEMTKHLVKNENKKTQHLQKMQAKGVHIASNDIPSENKKKRKQRIHLDKKGIEVREEFVGRHIQEGDNDHDICVDEASQQQKLKLRNRKDLTLQEKLQAIMALDVPGSKFITVAKRFGVSVSAISRINKNRDLIMLQAVSGDLNQTQRRSRECKDPELDKGLLKWYRTIEQLSSNNGPVAISNVLLKEKAHGLALTMGKNYFPSDNWIIRWKNRHNIGVKSSSTPTIIDREELRQLDVQVDLTNVLQDIGKPDLRVGLMKHESLTEPAKKADDLFICEHCGVLTSTKKKKGSSHLPGCPAISVRKDLTLEEKVQVVQALEQPGVKMVTLAKKYGVSASAISRIHKKRVDILARRASGLANSARRRDRGSKEPEVEKLLCEWFKVQLQLGIHISGSMIREKARDIAKVLGKDFWPSESWVFRWRHRNNVTDINTFLYGDGDEGELGGLGRNTDSAEGMTLSNLNQEVPKDKRGQGEREDASHVMSQLTAKKEAAPVNVSPSVKQFRLPLSVMCEKCGYVSYRVKNNRIKSLRHAKGCPDLKQRNEHTYENRARMLKALDEPGATLSSVARQFGVSVSSMSRMNQKKDQIFLHSEDHATQKRIRDCKEPEVAYTLYQWYMQKKVAGIHVTGPKLKEKAKRIAADFGREFNASSGWLGRWRHRYNISSSVRSVDYLPKNAMKKKKRRDYEGKMDNSSEDLAQLQEIPHEYHQNSIGSSESVIIESLEQGPALQLPQTTPVFIHQRFQNPWEIAQQQAEPCIWAKEFLTPAGSGVVDESAVSVAYTYGDTIPKPVFHNMFDSFSAVGYQVALPLDSSVIVSREYHKPEMSEDKGGPCGTHLAHASHSSHGQLSHHLASSITTQHHLQHHMQVTQPQSFHHLQPSQVQQQSQMNLSLPSTSPVTLDDDPEQQQQVMEALKIMSSFAQKKCLGDQVQAALRTIEMSMKGSPRKTSTRHTYTAI